MGESEIYLIKHTNQRREMMNTQSKRIFIAMG